MAANRSRPRQRLPAPYCLCQQILETLLLRRASGGRITVRPSRPHVVASAACFTLRLHASAAPPRVGLTQALGPMDVSQFSELEQTAMRKVIAYWILAWDWECPTLFGLEKNDLLAVLDDWPSHMKGDVEITDFAAAGALREYLYGASAVTAHKAKVETGLSQADLSLILHRLPPQK